jgi:hypothetical protein
MKNKVNIDAYRSLVRGDFYDKEKKEESIYGRYIRIKSLLKVII